MNEQIKKTAFETSAGTDEKQSLINSNNIITDEDDFCNSDDLFAEFREESNPNFIRTFTLGELFDKSYDIKQPIIKDLLYPGMYLFVGAPKIGKSFAMLQIAHHVSNGLDLWDKKVNQGKVVYLALEDRESRIVSRYYNMFGVPPNPDNIIISTFSNKAGHGLEGQLEYILARNQGVSLIIIDTLQMIRESSNDKMNYSSDMELLKFLKDLLIDSRCVCLLFITQESKIPMMCLIQFQVQTDCLVLLTEHLLCKRKSEARTKLLFPLPAGICPNNVFKLNARQIALGIL